MKTLKAFRLSEAAVARLEAKPNATQWLEELILGDDGKMSFKDMHSALVELFEYYTPRPEEEQKVPSNIFAGAETTIPPTPVENEVLESLATKRACCLAKSPCKHWQYNPLYQEYVNVLDGTVRSVE